MDGSVDRQFEFTTESPQNNSTPSFPRILSEEQRARKRQRDRAAQRERRTSTRKRINELESLVIDAVNQDNSNQLVALERLRNLQLENSQLKERLRVYEEVGSSQDENQARGLQGSRIQYQLPQHQINELDPTGHNFDMSIPTSGSDTLNSTTSAQFEDVVNPQHHSNAFTTSPQYTPISSSIQSSWSPESMSESIHHIPPQSFHATSAETTASMPNSGFRTAALSEPSETLIPSRHIILGNKVVANCSLEVFNGQITTLDPCGYGISNIINWALGEIINMPQYMVCFDDDRNQDAIIRGITQGWEAVGQRGSFCPLWGILRLLDDHVFWCCGYVQRFVMLRMIQYMLICRVAGNLVSTLPPWFRPRPLQYKKPHDLQIDYWAWPLFRERCIMSETSLLTNQFLADFAQGFVFHWPSKDTRTIYHQCPRSGLFRYNPEFSNAIGDIRMYMFNEAFYQKHPQLYDDTVPLESPRSLQLRSDSLKCRAFKSANRLQEIVEDKGLQDTSQMDDLFEADYRNIIPGWLRLTGILL